MNLQGRPGRGESVGSFVISRNEKLHLPHSQPLVQYHVQGRDRRIHARNCNINVESLLKSSSCKHHLQLFDERSWNE